MGEGNGGTLVCRIALIHLCELDTIVTIFGAPALKAPAHALKVPVAVIWKGGVLGKLRCYALGKQNLA